MVSFANHRLVSARSTSLHAATAALNLTSDKVDRFTPISTRRLGTSDRAGNSLATATPLSKGSLIADTVSRSDKDFFQVAITAPVDLRLSFTNRSRSVLVGSLLDSQGQVLALGGRQASLRLTPDRASSSRFPNVQPGIYYIRITTNSRTNSRYQLRLNVAAPQSIDPDCGCGP